MNFRLALVGLFFCFCTPRVIQYQNDMANFVKYRSFYILNSKSDHLNAAESNEVNNRIKPFIIDEMNRRGYEMDTETPDLILRFEIIYGSENITNSNLDRFNMTYYPRIRNNIVGALLIELIDNTTNKLIWQSSIDADNAMKKRKEKDPLRKLVIRLFNTYLYQAGNATPDEQLKIK
tara:strand:+ start:220 stop:750 length:531 start_codon:yes stop_codon:yes gene_type:complete